jgi:superfamily I DNA/RNA helicase
MKLIVLEDNYRSTQIILDASHGLGERIVKDPARLRARVKYDKAPIQITIYENDNQEINAIATSIKKK